MNTLTAREILTGPDFQAYQQNNGEYDPRALGDVTNNRQETIRQSIKSLYESIERASQGIESTAHDGSTYKARVAAARRMVGQWPMAVEMGGRRVPIIDPDNK